MESTSGSADLKTWLKQDEHHEYVIREPCSSMECMFDTTTSAYSEQRGGVIERYLEHQFCVIQDVVDILCALVKDAPRRYTSVEYKMVDISLR